MKETLTEKEACNEGIDFVYWRNANEDTEWVKTDDGYVVKIDFVSYLGGNKKTLIWHTPVGRFSRRKKRLVIDAEYEERKNAFYSGERKGVLTSRKRMFVDWYIRLGNPLEAFRRAYPGTSLKNAQRHYTRLLAQREVREYMNQKLDDILEQLGIDEEYILKQYKNIIDSTVEPGSTKISALNKLSEIIDLKKKVTEIEDKFVLLPAEDMKALQEAKQRSLTGTLEESSVDSRNAGSNPAVSTEEVENGQSE